MILNKENIRQVGVYLPKPNRGGIVTSCFDDGTKIRKEIGITKFWDKKIFGGNRIILSIR
jgi:hypothetical protein